MRALYRYCLADFLRSHRYFQPAAAYSLLVAVCYAAPRPIPVLSSYALTASLLFVVSGWLCANLMNAEDPIQAQITLIHSGRPALVHLSKLMVAVAVSSALGALAVVLPAALQVYGRPVTGLELVVGIGAHALLALLGAAVGSHFTEALTASPSNAWGGMAVLWAMSFSWKGLQAALPGPLKGIVWALPPVTPLVDILLKWDAGGITGSAVAGLAAVSVLTYSALLALLFIRRMMP